MKYCKRIALIVCVFCAGCFTTLITDTRNPDQLRDRAKTLEAQVSASQRTSRKYELLAEGTDKDIERREKRLEAHEAKKQKLDARIRELEHQKRQLSETEADKLQFTINNYEDERDAVKAKVDENRSLIRHLNNHLSEQKSLQKSYQRKAQDARERARRLREKATTLSEPKESS